jgi:hypothetical protein
MLYIPLFFVGLYLLNKLYLRHAEHEVAQVLKFKQVSKPLGSKAKIWKYCQRYEVSPKTSSLPLWAYLSCFEGTFSAKDIVRLRTSLRLCETVKEAERYNELSGRASFLPKFGDIDKQNAIFEWAAELPEAYKIHPEPLPTCRVFSILRHPDISWYHISLFGLEGTYLKLGKAVAKIKPETVHPITFEIPLITHVQTNRLR